MMKNTRNIYLCTVVMVLCFAMEALGCNQAPHSWIGNWYQCVKVDTDISFNGSYSYDPDGYLVAWEWDLPGAAYDISYVGPYGEPDSCVKCKFNAVGKYNLYLDVTDNDGASDSDYAVVYVVDMDISSESGHNGYIAVNNDDDNENGIMDFWETQSMSIDDDDLVKFSIYGNTPSWGRYESTGGRLMVNSDSVDTTIKAWDDKRHASLLFDYTIDYKEWLFTGPFSHDVYIEGMYPSSGSPSADPYLEWHFYNSPGIGMLNWDATEWITVVDVDMDMEGVQDEHPVTGTYNSIGATEEITPGGMIAYEGLVKLTLKKVQGTTLTPQITLAGSGSTSKIKVWLDQNKSSEFTLGGVIANNNDLPMDVWVEGVSISASPRDISLKMQCTLGGEVFEDVIKLSIVFVEMTAYRPQTEEAGYGQPFLRREVPDSLEEIPGAGIRENGSLNEGSNEKDLIEVKLNVAPLGLPCVLLRRTNLNIKVWDSYDKGNLLLGILDHETEIVVNSSPISVWVESPMGGSDDLEIVVKPGSTDVCSDKVHFYPFTSVVVIFEGEFGIPSDLPSQGIGELAVDMYENGYDVHWYDEPDITKSPNSENTAINEISNAVTFRDVSSVALIGYSHGGGSVYNVSDAMTGGDLVFSAYIDAIQQPFLSILAMNTRPVSSDYHVNYYQVANANDAPFFLDGMACTPTGPGWEVNVDYPVVTEEHTSIDDAELVKTGILYHFYQQTNR